MQLSKGSPQQLVYQLDHHGDIASEARILRKIKNDLAGHELRKIEYIRAGLIPALAEVLSTRTHHTGQGSTDAILITQVDEENVWWQASSIFIVLSNAGTLYTHALLDSNLIPLLLARLRVVSPAERVLANILHGLNAFAMNLPLDAADRWTANQSLASYVYTDETALCLSTLVATIPKSLKEQQRLKIVLQLICNTCRDESHILLLDEFGLLDSLCDQLATHISSQNVCLDGESSNRHLTYNIEQSSLLTLILETISLVIEHSRSRTDRFNRHDAVQRAVVRIISPPDVWENLSADDVQSTDFVFDVQNVRHDFRPPFVPDLHTLYLSRKSTWPPLTHSTDRPSLSRRQSPNQVPQNSNAPPDAAPNDLGLENLQSSPVVLWLQYVVRMAHREPRIMAARLLVILKSHHLLNGRTIRSFAALLVPILVEMLDRPQGGKAPLMQYSEHVPAILALLVKDQEDLQQAAVEAKAIPKLAHALKLNFEAVQESTSDIWWPTKLQSKLTAGPRDRSLGPGGPSRPLRLRMQMREGLLQALAALAPDSDVFRKDICDHGALSHIVLALEPFQSHVVAGEYYDRLAVAGNSSEALIAACGAVRALTRSPTSLRTKIVDADVTKHVINLLYTAEVAVRLAATKVIANLSHGFSPMRNHIAEPTVIKKLCEQAHSAHAELRKETLFALKAFVNLCSNDVKRTVVEELGIDWIRRILATDPRSVPHGEIIGLIEKDHRKGALNDKHEDTDMHDVGSNDLDHEIARYNRHTPEQDFEILAELLGFLRNLTTGEHPAEIIDLVLERIGVDDFLQLIVERLRSVSTNFPRLSAKIVENCIYTVAHLAIADAKYRSLVARNLILMKQMNAFLGHAEATIRRACCWLVIGIVYSTSESYLAAASRARDLSRLGVLANLRRMEKSDLDTDVKERASTACDIFTKLLDKN